MASRGTTAFTFPVSFSSIILSGAFAYSYVGGQNYGTGQGVMSYSKTSMTVGNTSETGERYWAKSFCYAVGTI